MNNITIYPLFFEGGHKNNNNYHYTCMVELSSVLSVQCAAAGKLLISSSDIGALLLRTIVSKTSRATWRTKLKKYLQLV